MKKLKTVNFPTLTMIFFITLFLNTNTHLISKPLEESTSISGAASIDEFAHEPLELPPLNERSYQNLLAAANAGNSMAQEELIIRRYWELLPYCHQDQTIPVETWGIKEKAQNTDLYAYFVLVTCTNEIITTHYPQLLSSMQLRANTGNILAQSNLGVAHYMGKGVEQSNEKAIEHFEMAANNDHCFSQSYLGGIYLEQQNYEQAVPYLQSAAESGHPGAQDNLGILYLSGTGVEKSPVIAAEWIRKSAQQGSKEALNNLGTLYLRGVGVRQSNESAKILFRAAKNQGHLEATVTLNHVLLEDIIDEIPTMQAA